MIHDLKIWPEYFEAVRSGLKTFEIRENDRNFKIGDALQLREYNPNTEEFSGKSILRLVKYIVEGPPFVPEGWVVMSIADSIEIEGGSRNRALVWQSGYMEGYVNGCSDATKIIHGTVKETPIGIGKMIQDPTEELGSYIDIRAARMIHEDPERIQEPGK